MYWTVPHKAHDTAGMDGSDKHQTQWNQIRSPTDTDIRQKCYTQEENSRESLFPSPLKWTWIYTQGFVQGGA